MPSLTIVDLLEQDRSWLRADGTLVPVGALDRPEVGAIVDSLRQRASLLWFAAMWRADHRYVGHDVAALDVVSPQRWLEDRPLVRALVRALRTKPSPVAHARVRVTA